MNIDFEWYKVFFFAARELSFTHAAEQLGNTQSAVSQAVKNLETAAGCTLFVRKPRGLLLTHEGRELYSFISQGYRFFRLGEEKISEMTRMEIGTIKIGVSDTVCRYFLINHIQKFMTDYPGVKISVVNRTSSGITRLVTTGEIDFGIISLPDDNPELDILPFRSVEDIFVAAPAFSRLKQKPCSIRQIAENPMLLLYKESRTRQNLEHLFDQLGITAVSPVEFESIDLLMEFARIGAGVAHVMKESAQHYIKTGELFRVHTKETLPARQLGICRAKGGAVSAASQRFIDTL